MTQQQVRQTFEAAVMRHLYPRTQIDIQVSGGLLQGRAWCMVLSRRRKRKGLPFNPPPLLYIHIQIYIMQSDGSALPAVINATSLALVDAGIGMKEMVAACSVALLDDHAVLVSK